MVTRAMSNVKTPYETIHFISLGCPKNRVDTETLAGIAQERGLSIVADPEAADVIVVNTCGFIEAAREESVEALCEAMSYKEKGRCRLLVATGCLSQRYAPQMEAELPEYDHLLGTTELEKFASILSGTAERVEVGPPGHHLASASHARFIEPGAASAYIKIADGCSRRCAFCAIPLIRGKRSVSRPVADIAEEARRLVDRGIVELNLVAQDSSAWGKDLPGVPELADLLSTLDTIRGLRWIRVLYLYPDGVTDKLLRTIRDCEKVVPYIDVPIQHASARVLKAMRRGHGPSTLKRLIEKTRKILPDAFLRTAVLVGHPGETKEDFETLCEFISWARFDHLGAFRYSEEEGTAAFQMTPKVNKQDSYNRYRKLLSIQRRISKRNLALRVGHPLEVLVEGAADENSYVLEGRHRGQAPEIDGRTYIVSSESRAGDIIRARIIKTEQHDIVVEPWEPETKGFETPQRG